MVGRAAQGVGRLPKNLRARLSTEFVPRLPFATARAVVLFVQDDHRDLSGEVDGGRSKAIVVSPTKRTTATDPELPVGGLGRVSASLVNDAGTHAAVPS